jgi:hypothetical protein
MNLQKYCNPPVWPLSFTFARNLFFMKKAILLILILVIAGFTVYRLFFKTDPKPESPKDQPLTISKNSQGFNDAFANLLKEYLSLKDALVEWDSAKATQQAGVLQKSAEELPFGELKADTAIVLTAKDLATSIANESKGFVAESTLEQKRRAFNMITSFMYDLLRSVKFDRQIIYHVKCPMAFNESEEAYWLSDKPDISNPYLGNKHPKFHGSMETCGEIVDSLDFAKK